MNKIIITTGDPNGVGAEITIKALNALDLPVEDVLILSNKKIIDFYGKLNKNYEIYEIPFDGEVEPGQVNICGGEFSFLSVKKACELKGRAIVTAPVAKSALNLAGHNFSGQTEILQKYLAHGSQHAEMLFIARDFRVLLLTRHCPLKEINISQEMVVDKIMDLNKFLKIDNAKFALCGLNPHAGENGILGSEEREILIPAVEELKENGIDITQPLPADTLFVRAAKNYFENRKLPYDCYIAIYHDQGLIPIKTVAGSKTVNMTIGLDVIRTSPGHGTAFDIAGKNIAGEQGMIEAIKAVL